MLYFGVKYGRIKITTAKAKATAAKAKGGSNLKKKTAFILALILTISVFTACGGSNDKVKCVEIVKACKDITPEGSFDEWYSYGEEAYDESFSNLYGVQYDMVDDGAILQTAAGGTADEVSVLHMKKNEDVSIAQSKLQDRIAERTSKFSGYKPEEVYKLDNARVIVQGNYVCLIAADDPDSIETEIRRVISEGNQ